MSNTDTRAMTTKVSILIPAYNTGQFIARTIESVLNQSFRDFELIIVDDVSTDDTYAVCEQYARKDERIKLYKNEKNLGMMPNWVYGVGLCKGQYWGKLDCDDIWAPEMLAECVRILDNHEEVGLVATRYVNMDEHSNLLPGTEYFFPTAAREQAISFVPFVKSGISGMFKGHIAQQGIGLIRRKIFDELGNFTLLPAGDTEMWFRIGGHYKIYCLDALMHYHRVWADSFTRTHILKANKLEQNLYEVREVIFDHYYAHQLINKKEYSDLKRANKFEWSKVQFAQALKQTDMLKALGLLSWNLFHFPVKTFRFYLKRLGDRF